VTYHPAGGADPADVAAVLALVEAAENRPGRSTVIAIDGPSGSGKTSLATAVASRLHAPIVHMDDLYPGWDGLAVAVDLVTTQVLQPLARGERAAYRRWDWHRSRWAETVPVPDAPTLVLEGCGSSVRPAGDYASVRVWVEAPASTRRERGIARDGVAYAPHWERWMAQERDLFAADGTRERAHLVIDTAPTVDN
jgi:uridine kinase